jgi:hypothetical protein
MTTSMNSPGPRDGLDVARPRPWVASSFGPIDVPEDASALIDGLAGYGA